MRWGESSSTFDDHPLLHSYFCWSSSYDRNNWVETPESLEMKASLDPEAVLIEGTDPYMLYRSSYLSDLTSTLRQAIKRS